LTDPLDEAAFERRIRANAAMLTALAGEVLARVREIDATVLDDLPTLAALQTHAPHLLREAA
jgi:hypothetical protein